MVSGFICPCHGEMSIAAAELLPQPLQQPVQPQPLQLSQQQPVQAQPTQLPAQADPFHHSKLMFGKEMLSSFTVFEPGANAQGYWTGQDVVHQAVEVEKIFTKLHPGKVGVFEFDNSTNHSVLPKGALHVDAGVNKGPGGKNAPGNTTGKKLAKMRDGWYINKETGNRVAQQMHFASGQFKGTQQILKERGVTPMPSLGKCTKTSRQTKRKRDVDKCNQAELCCCHNVSLGLLTFFFSLLEFELCFQKLYFICL